MDKIETYGQMQIRLEATLEVLGSLSYSLRQMVEQNGGDDKQVRYYLDAAIEKVQSISNAMVGFWGSTDGQLCPYKDCSRNLAFRTSGWWLCSHCKRPFWAGHTDSDFEDFHAYTVYKVPQSQRPIPPLDSIEWARDMGPSWASPETSDA